MVRIRVTGKGALFLRPEIETDEISYDMITPHDAYDILESIYWIPEMYWKVEKIYIMKPIQFVESIVYKKEGSAKRIALKDVEYIIEASFSIKNDAFHPARVNEIVKRRINTNKLYRPALLGGALYPAEVSFYSTGQNIVTPYKGALDLGYMLYNYKAMHARFFRAVLQDGVLDCCQVKTYR